MKNMKKFLIALAVVGLAFVSNIRANAADIGIVDLDKIVGEYSKAQDVSADLKSKEAELQKFLADAQKQLKATTSPVEKKNLEDKLAAQFKTKSEDFRDSQITQWKQIEEDVINAIQKVSNIDKIDIVLNKASVILGGKDISDEVLAILNTKSK